MRMKLMQVVHCAPVVAARRVLRASGSAGAGPRARLWSTSIRFVLALAVVVAPAWDGARAQVPAAHPALTLDAAGGATVLARQGDGKIVAGGEFSKGNGAPRSNLARFDSAGALDAGFNPAPNGRVTAVAVSGSSIYVAGWFTTIGGVARARIAKLNVSNGSVDLAFNPAPDDDVTSLAVDASGNVYAAGFFSTIGGVSGRKIVKLNGSTGAADPAFNPVFPQALLRVGALGVHGAHLYVVGFANCIVNVNPNVGRAHRVVLSTGLYDPTWTPPSADVNNEGNNVSLAFDAANRVYVASLGGLTSGTYCGSQLETVTVARFLGSDGSADGSWTPPANGSDYVAIDGASLYTSTVVPSAIPNAGFSWSIVKRDAATGAAAAGWTSPDLGPGNELLAAVVAPEGIWVAGRFSRMNGAFVPGFARLEKATGAPQPAVTSSITFPGYGLAAAELPGGKFLLGGRFDYVDGTQRSNLVRLAADGQLDSTWTTQADDEVWRLTVHGTHVYAGGFFATVGGVPRGYAARFDADTGAVDGGWNANVDGIVRRFAFDAADVYLSGGFANVGGVSRPYLAKVSGGDGSLVGAFAPPFTEAACFQGTAGLAHAGGYVYSGVSRSCLADKRVARFAATTGAHDTTWNPDPDGSVREILVLGADAYLVGDFNAVGGVVKPGLAKVALADGTLAAGWGDVPLAEFPYTAAIVGPYLYVGGESVDAQFVSNAVVGRHVLASGLHDASWAPTLTTPARDFGNLGVRGIAGSLTGSRVLIAGDFSAASGEARDGFAAFAMPAPSGVALRRTHGTAGTFDLALNLDPSNPMTEPRRGPDHTVVFTFEGPVSGGSAAVVEGAAAAGTPTISGNEVSVPLTGVGNEQYVTVALSGVQGAGASAGGGSVRIGFLLGDVNQNRVITVSDLGLVNAQIAQFVTAANYLKDVNASGTLTVADKGITNTQITKALPPP